MSLVALSLNLMLAILLLAALAMGWRLNARLKALRDSHDGFARAVAELDAAALRAEQGLADLRAATDEAADALADRIDKARGLTARLERLMSQAPAAANQDVGAADAERIAERRIGALLAAVREPRARADIPREAPLSRPRPAFDADLFDEPEEPVRLSLRGARR